MGIPPVRRSARAFTLIELLTVVAIISRLISIRMPSLTRARDQAKGVHCLARLKDFANALAGYENIYGDQLPPAHWYMTDPARPNDPPELYGWAELLFAYIYREKVDVQCHFPVMRNVEGEKWEEYFLCKASNYKGVNSGHYRVYLPSWAAGTYSLEEDGTFGETTQPDPFASVSRSSIRPRLPLLGDSNETSERGGSCGDALNPTSYIGPGEANEAGTTGQNGNRFSDRHYGGTNFLYQDLHADWQTRLREKLAVDWDLNGVEDIEVIPPP
ncbi:MAG TPA: type II secretion system protein [Phycisphaerae bacterium]|nr:type II secretion system protein [Phycisphaerae bacterium]